MRTYDIIVVSRSSWTYAPWLTYLLVGFSAIGRKKALEWITLYNNGDVEFLAILHNEKYKWKTVYNKYRLGSQVFFFHAVSMDQLEP